MDDETFEERKSEFIGIRISPDVKELLIDEAKQRGQTLSAFCYELIDIGYGTINGGVYEDYTDKR